MELLDYDREKSEVTIKMKESSLRAIKSMAGSFCLEFNKLDEYVHNLDREDARVVSAELSQILEQTMGYTRS